MKRQHLVAWGLLAGLAIAVRLLYQTQIRDYILYQVPLIDAEEYVAWARSLAEGQPQVRDVYYKAPLYPYLLAGCMRLLGAQLSTAYLLNGFLGTLNVVLISIWVRRLAGMRWALIAGAFAGVYGPFLYFEAQAMPTALGVTLAMFSLLGLSANDARPGWRSLVIVGVSLGLLALTRPSFFVWVAVAMLWVWRGPARNARGALVLLLLSALIVLPVTVRNRLVGGSWVLVSANGGINFFLGNNADAARTAAMRPGLEWDLLVSALPESERQGQARWDRYFARRAREWVLQHPLDFAVGLGQKTLQYLNAYEIDRNLDARGFRAQSHLLRWSPRYACLAPWVILGLIVAWRRGGIARLAAFYWLASLGATILIFVTERYRVDAAPAALALALLGLAEVEAHVRRRRTLVSRVSLIVLVIVGAVVALHRIPEVRGVNPAQASVLEGMALYKEARYGSAVERFRVALVEYPGDGNAHYQLATALQKQNRFQEALVEFEAAHRAVPKHPKPLVGAGALLRRAGKLEEARQRYETALAADPRNALVHLELASLLEQMEEHASAITHYRLVLETTDRADVAAEARRALDRLSAPRR